MLYVVVVPGWIWAIALIVLWLTLVRRALFQLKLEGKLIKLLLGFTALQLIAACSVAIATMIYRINMFACLMGFFGLWGTLIVALVEAALLVLLYKVWPRDADGSVMQFKSFAVTWFFFALVAVLIHARSATLCTV